MPRTPLIPRSSVGPLVGAAALFAVTALGAFAVEAPKPPPYTPPVPLKFPAESKTRATLSLEQLQTKTDQLEAVIGGYPPKISGEAQRQQVYREWSGLLQQWRALRRTAKEDNERLLVLGIMLHRQGHNLDVRDSAQHALDLLDRAERAYPESADVAWQGSYFYLQIDPKYAPRGEQALLKLRRLLQTEKDPRIERGFLFAYIYQQRLDDALKQADHLLELTPDDRQVRAMRDAIAKGQVQVHHEKLGPDKH